MTAQPPWASREHKPLPRVHRLRAWSRAIRVALHKVRWALLTLIVVLLGGTFLFWLSGTYDNPLKALLYVLNLITLQVGPEDLPGPAALQLISGALMLGGLGAIAGGAARVVQLVADPKEQQLALVSTLRDHIVVCGIGRVGYRVINELLDFGETVVGVNKTENEEWLETLKRSGVPIIIGDARRKQTLIDAGIERASAIVACTSDELANLDMSLDARELNPQIKVVLRMFDAKLAANVSKGFNIQTVFSVSALAAPAFATAATRARVNYSFKLEGQLLNVSTITFQPSSPFIGKTVGQIEDELQCAIVGTWDGERMRMNPHHAHVVQPGERYYVLGDLNAIRRLNNGQ